MRKSTEEFVKALKSNCIVVVEGVEDTQSDFASGVEV